MQAEEIQSLLRRQPFEPIRLHLTDGKSFDIRHPDMVILTNRSIEIGVPIRAGSKIAQQVHYCSLLHVVRTEVLNGKSRRRRSKAS